MPNKTEDIGYHCGYTPGDGSVFDHLIDLYGARLENMGQEVKYGFTASILCWLGSTDEKEMFDPNEPNAYTLHDVQGAIEAPLGDELLDCLPAIQQLSVMEQLGLCETMIAQLKEAYRERLAQFNSLKRSFQQQLESQGVSSELAVSVGEILAYEQQNPHYQRTLEEQALITQAHQDLRVPQG